jgi:hypothetical protein
MRSYREGRPDPENWPDDARQLLGEAVGSLDDSAGDVESWASGPDLYARPGEAAVPASQPPPDLRKTRKVDT